MPPLGHDLYLSARRYLTNDTTDGLYICVSVCLLGQLGFSIHSVLNTSLIKY